MSFELPTSDHSRGMEELYFEWLETHVRDLGALVTLQERLKTTDPLTYRIMVDAARELAPHDPKSHATHCGTFLLLLADAE